MTDQPLSKITKPRVLIVLYKEMGSVTCHVRGIIYGEPLRQMGWTVEFVEVQQVAEDSLVALAANFDLVYLLKIPFLSLIQKLRNQTNAKLIFDLTDALWMPHHRWNQWQDLEAILSLVDGVFSDNEFVASYGRKFNPSVHVIPPCTQVERFDLARSKLPARTTNIITIGWVGTASTINALHVVRDSLEHLFLRHPNLTLRLLVYGFTDPASLPHFEHVRFSILPKYDEDDMIREVLQMDIGLFPPPCGLEDYVIRGVLKSLIYMTGGIASVCQNAGVCATLIQDGINGMLASDPLEWEQKLELLINSPELRKQMGINALATVKNTNSLAAITQALANALLSVLHQTARISGTQPTVELNSLPPTVSNRPKIIIIADVPNWIFDRHAHKLKNELSDSYDIDIAYMGQAFDEASYDLIHPLEWNLVPLEQIKNPRKWITGIRSHISWNSLNFQAFCLALREKFAVVYVVSEQLLEIFQPHVPQIKLLAHGIDTHHFKAIAAPTSESGRLRVGWAGNRKSPAKGFESLIEPLNGLPGVNLVYCGYSDRLMTLEEMPGFYESIDAYVCSSSSEGHNNSLMEAAAMERAIITTNVGTVAEYLVNGLSALIVPRDHAAIAEAVIRLRDDPALRVRLGIAARQAVLAKFDWRERIIDHRMAFNELLSRNGRFASAADEAFLFVPDWNEAAWCEVVLSFVIAFRPDEAVCLLLRLSSDAPSFAVAQQKLSELLLRTGFIAAPRIELVAWADSEPGKLQGYRNVHLVPVYYGQGAEPEGELAARFNAARYRLLQSFVENSPA